MWSGRSSSDEHGPGDGVGRGDLHALGDRRGLGVERAPEDAGEGEHVVDLVREVADRPVAMTAARSWMASGRISGSGLAMANTIGSAAIDSTSSAVMIPGPLTPMNTSAPGMTSDSVPVQLLGVGLLGEPPLGLVEVVAAVVDGALAVGADDVLDAGVLAGSWRWPRPRRRRRR